MAITSGWRAKGAGFLPENRFFQGIAYFHLKMAGWRSHLGTSNYESITSAMYLFKHQVALRRYLYMLLRGFLPSSAFDASQD